MNRFIIIAILFSFLFNQALIDNSISNSIEIELEDFPTENESQNENNESEEEEKINREDFLFLYYCSKPPFQLDLRNRYLFAIKAFSLELHDPPPEIA